MRRFPAILIALSLFCLNGCGSRFVPVEGTVTCDGKPLDGAMVSFVPEEMMLGQSDRRTAFGYTDAAGHFFLKTERAVGALPGKYKVTVAKGSWVALTQKDLKNARSTPPPRLAQPRSVLPDRYGDPKETPLGYTVPAGGAHDAHFDVESKDR